MPCERLDRLSDPTRIARRGAVEVNGQLALTGGVGEVLTCPPQVGPDLCSINWITERQVGNVTRQSFSTEQIVRKLREADVWIGQGLAVPEVIRRLEVSDKTYYRWRKEYGGLKVDQAKRLKRSFNRRTPGSRSC